MYVKSMVLDGFKSYGTRTEINGFDREFNAITGLNGSGKSNILDAICFVLGLQNLGQVRATLLQDLVYKQGQTGVTRATVSITFDNTNKQQSPVGYESYDEIVVTRQVVMGGKNKYFINGLNAPNNRVKDLFCSVQLNVNNPHFLVMQGRITKVLNMKPLEILSMIEEAAGTRMFESKRQQAEKTLEKKDAKLAEIDSIITDDIGPKLRRLKEERGQYLEFKKVERELDHITKIYFAWKYMNSKQTAQEAEKNSVKLKVEIETLKIKITNGIKEEEELNKQIVELQKVKDAETGGKFNQVESALREKEKSYTTLNGLHKQCLENIQDEKKKMKQLEKNLEDDDSLLNTKTSKLSKINDVFQKLTVEEEKDKILLEKAQNKYQALSAGLVADDPGKQSTLQDKLMEAEKLKTEAETEINQCELQLNHCQKEIKKKTVDMEKTENDFIKDDNIQKKLVEKIATLESQISSLKHDVQGTEKLQKEYKELKHEIRGLKENIESLESKCMSLNFRYKDPEPNFNRKSVHGMVCKLVGLVHPQFAIAVEKTAGGKLFNVVVDTDIISKKLLDKGKLETRTTIIPLNKIQGRKIDPRVIKEAENLVGKENVWPALSVVNYDPILEPAMQYVFGTTFICRTLDVAKKVCFHPNILKKCVTLDGDTCDPAGTLSGGARQPTTPIILKVLEMRELSDNLNIKENRMSEIENILKSSQAIREQHNSLKQKLDLKSYELSMVREKLGKSAFYQLREEVNSLKEKINTLTEKQDACKEIIAKESKNIEEIQHRLVNAKEYREIELKEAEKEIKTLKKKSEQSRQDREKRTEEYDLLKFEIEEIKKSSEINKEQIEEHLKTISEMEVKQAELEKQVEEAGNEVKKFQAELKSVKEAISKKSKEITKANDKKDFLIKERRDLELQIKENEQKLKNLKSEVAACQKRIEDYLKTYEWIRNEEQYFGMKNGIYDFEENNPHEAGKRMTKLQETKERLGRNINKKAMSLLTRTEEQYNELMKKRQQVEDDKKKILEVIHDLGEKKKEALRQAWLQVNRDFGSIFSTLLPGAVARLDPPEGQTVLDGLEFKVGFGGKWKESLGELSGGQRSLVALSLILAMLLFKPAPIYILDEVDAALDLSHTQNIGTMLKTHFKTSQFIIVSLKDGMFNNANVLFRTRFADGVSNVSRNVQGPNRKRLKSS